MDSIEIIVKGIWDDICDRSGGDHFLCGLDREIRDEIKESWRKIIEQALKGGK